MNLFIFYIISKYIFFIFLLAATPLKSEHFDKSKVIGVSGNVSNIKLSSFLVIRPEKMSYHINLLNSYTIHNDFKNLMILLFPSKVV